MWAQARCSLESSSATGRAYDSGEMATARESDRLRTLLETGIAISSELSLDAVLERIVRAAATLTGARYAALGVIDRSGTALERFITTGVDEQTRAAIGDPPRGRGILGVLIREAKTLRLRDLQDDPRSVGFPPNHPELRDFLGARIVAIALPGGEGELRVEAAAGEGSADVVGAHFPRVASKAGAVLERKRSERVDSMLEDPEIHQESARLFRATTGLFVPLLAREEAIGVVIVHDKLGPDLRFTDADLRLAEQFGARAAIAVDLSRRVARDSLRRVVAGQELERQRLARELHDETGQALTSILLGLKAVEEARAPGEMHAAAAGLRELVVATLQDVRRLAVELRPKALDDFGLVAALERLVQTFSEATTIGV